MSSIRQSKNKSENVEMSEAEMEEKLMRELEDMDNDLASDSQLEGSVDFYQGLKQKLNNQIAHMRVSTTNDNILKELKTNIGQELNNMEKYQEQINELKNINTTEQSFIATEKINEIKSKISQDSNHSKIILADDEVQKKEQIHAEQQRNFKKTNPEKYKLEIKRQQQDRQKNQKFQAKLFQANLERERINMQREDQLSMKYEHQWLSEFFKDRFLQPKMTVPKSVVQQFKLSFKVTKPMSTFTNLTPLPNNQANVLPRNAPELALKSLQKNKSFNRMPISNSKLKIQFKRNSDFTTNNVQNNHFSKIHASSPTIQKTILNENDSFQDLLSKSLQKMRVPFKQIQRISKQYKPKFIKSYLNEDEKILNIDVSDVENGNKPLKMVLENNETFEENKDPTKLKQFRLTFQQVTDIKGIQDYSKIQQVALQHNLIKSVSEIKNCSYLIQINLSNNRITDAQPLRKLQWLRYLNMNDNSIREVQLQGGSLQILYMRRNRIEQILSLNANKNLKILDLSENKLHAIGKGFDKLYFLQELLLSKNYIAETEGLATLALLQKLDLSHNRIQNFSENVLSFLFLNFLDLSYNKLESVPQMLLPSLQKLYITNNKIKGQSYSKYTLYLPQLKQFNIDDNELSGFSSVWSFIKFSKKLQILKYDSNDYFLSVRQKVRELYESIIYRNMKNIKILNLSPMDKGIKAYYESVYDGYLKRGVNIQTIKGMKKAQLFISFLLKQNLTILQLQEESSKIQNKKFIETDIYIQAKSTLKAKNFGKILSILESIQNSKRRAQQKQILLLQPSIYYHHDNFQFKNFKSLYKIQSLFIKHRYSKQKRKKYFMSQQPELKKILPQIENALTKLAIKKVISKFSVALKISSQQVAAVLIQAQWRGYKTRKLFKKMMAKIKKASEDDDFEDFGEFDQGVFQEHEFPQFDFDMPEDIHFEDLIIEPRFFEISKQQQQKRNSKNARVKEFPKIKIQEHHRPMKNNFFNQEQKEQEKNKKKQEQERKMKQWGFQNPASLEALQWKKKRLQQMKKKQAEKNMSAAQRYKRFKQVNK